MTTHALDGGVHLTDDALLTSLDGESGAAEAEQVAAHLDRCDVCRTRLDELRAASRRVADLVGNIEAAPPVDFKQRVLAAARSPRVARPARPALWSNTLFKAAAGVVLFVGLASATPSVRTWIVAQAARAFGPAEPTTPVQTEPPATSISFVATEGVLPIEVQTRQTGGTLTLRAGEGRRVRATRVGGLPEEGMAVTGGLRIENAAASSGSYEIEVPDGITTVEVRIAGAAAGTWTLDRIRDDGVVVELSLQ